MSISPEFIEQLLLSDEDTTLDFKRDQYEFEGATKEAKSELLKDKLAFANAFRRSDAYILVGVEEKRGAKSEVVGIAAHLDDAKLQQFVNSKTQLPVTFSYREVTHDGRAIGVLHIPLQSRPVYATADYGKIKKEAVYIRRGSSTAIAKPEEVMRMGAQPVGPDGQTSVDLYLVDRETGRRLEQPVRVEESTWYEVPPKEAILDYCPERTMGSGMFEMIQHAPEANADYYREAAAYAQVEACLCISLELENTGGSVVHDAKLGIELPDPERRYELLGPVDIPDRPDLYRIGLMTRGIVTDTWQDVTVRREGEVWRVDCDFGKIQPRSKVRLRNDLLIGARIAGDLRFRGRIYADNISSPNAVGFDLSFGAGSKQIDSPRIEKVTRGLMIKRKKGSPDT